MPPFEGGGKGIIMKRNKKNFWYDENLKEFLARNENRYTPEEYFEFLEKSQDENFRVRKFIATITPEDSENIVYYQEIRVVFGIHFKRRAQERMRGLYFYEDQIDAVMKILEENPKVAERALDKPYCYEDGEGLIPPDGKYQSTAAVKVGLDFVPIFTAGTAFIFVETVIPKKIDADDVKTRATTDKVKI